MLQKKQEVDPNHISEDVDMQGAMAHEPPEQVESKMLTERCATSVTGNAGNSTNKKKKGKVQIFYCCDFPPCNLSFTRSEHLARHIRKHTGEKPFQCHCSRRFSRLDNLRQHAQSIHQNEKIPEDSLATFGIRSQRQTRSDKGRAVGNRTRAYTADSHKGPIRGHKRNSWSVSSIGSISSAYSASYEQDARKPIPHPVNSDESVGLSDSELTPIKQQKQKQSLSSIEFSPLSLGNEKHNSESSCWRSGLPPSSPNSIFPRNVDQKLSQVPTHRMSFPLPLVNPSVPLTVKTSSSLTSGNLCMSAQMKNSLTVTTSSLAYPLPETNTQSEESSRRRTWHPDILTAFSFATPKTSSSPLFTHDRLTQSPISPSIAPSSTENLWLPGIESFGSPDKPKTPPPRACSYLKTDTARNLWHTQDPHQGQSSVTGEQVINRNMHRLEINSHENTSSMADKAYITHQNNNGQKTLTTKFKKCSYPDQDEISGHADPRPYVKIPPIMLHNETYVGDPNNLTGSPHISTHMAELRVHSSTKSADILPRAEHAAFSSLRNLSTDRSQSNFLTNNSRSILNYSELGRRDQSISRSPFLHAPGTSTIYPLELSFQSQRFLTLNLKSNERLPISRRLDTLVAGTTR